MISKVLICVLVLHICDAYNNAYKSSDCVLVRSCPEAIKFAGNGNDRERNKQLTASFCGTEVVNGKMLPKINCSHFRAASPRFATSNENDSDALESHPNLGLLPRDCGKINGERIINGKVASLYEFPWMALIATKARSEPGSNKKYKFKCGGSVINSKYILTAAHCVVGKKLVGVRIGELDIDTKEDCQGEYPHITCEPHIQDRMIEEVIAHEDYQHKPMKDDIALLRLKKPIDFSYKNAKPICLPVSQSLRNVVLDHKNATVAGWGMTENGTESHILLKVGVPVLTAEACRNILDIDDKENVGKICAGELNKDSCTGDSGGPLMLEDENIPKIIQYGIVSNGPSDCGSELPGVYTNVSSYVKWILDNIKP